MNIGHLLERLRLVLLFMEGNENLSFEEIDRIQTDLELGIETIEQLMQMIIYDNLQFSLIRLREVRQHLLEAQATLRERQLRTFTASTTLAARNITMNRTRQSYSGRRGRPVIFLNIEQVEMLRSTGYTWQQVAECLHVSRTTLWRRLREANYSIERFTDISDDVLDQRICELQRNHPNVGYSLIYGFLLGMGIHIQRSRIRASMNRIDPFQRSLRWNQRLTRRTYCVPGPNALWHIDGHHSLIRWRFVIHGGIDGFSRSIVFLHCSTNNRAYTVFRLFREAMKDYGLPSRVRSDKGGENIVVCTYMIAARGTGRRSHNYSRIIAT